VTPLSRSELKEYRPPDVWTAFLLHQVEAVCAGKCCNQAISLKSRQGRQMSVIEIYRQPKRLRLTSWQCADNPSAPQNIKASNSGVKYMIPSSEKLLKFAPVAVFLASDQSA
jgi:hypothetical protein